MSYRSLQQDTALIKMETGDPNDTEHEEDNVVVHNVIENKGAWTHVEDLDTFFTRMYHYYLKGGFLAMLIASTLDILQYCFVVYFLTFLIYCVNYPVLFREDKKNSKVIGGNVTFADIIYPNCSQNITFGWWIVLIVLGIIGFIKAARSIYNLYHAYDIKMFYNKELKINDDEIDWISWSVILNRVRDAQKELQICIQKSQLTELDIYQRILRFDNYFIAMVNKKLLPLHINIPFYGELPYLSKGLRYNLESILFYNHWSPWENCWHLRDTYKDNSKRLELAKALEKHILKYALVNAILFPVIQAWQILYFFFNYAELIKRSPGTFGLRTWSIYSRTSLRHFNELEHDMTDRLHKAYKPAVKYLSSFPSPITNTIAKYVAFMSGSVLGVLVFLSLYDEVVLNVVHMITVITVLSCIVAIARSSISENGAYVGSSEELLREVQQYAHYLPASWNGKAHTKTVASNFEKLFQFRAVYLIMELISPILCPFILYSLRKCALDIVDFYRNFSITVPGIGDICSFSQMDVQKHGNPDWPPDEGTKSHAQKSVSQYYQGEDGKTELSLIAFSLKNPTWQRQHTSQQEFLEKLHNSVERATNVYLSHNTMNSNSVDKSMLGSHYNKIMTSGGPASLNLHRSSYYRHDASIIEEDDDISAPYSDNDVWKSGRDMNNPIMPNKMCDKIQEENAMSINTYHLYDLHNSKIRHHPSRYNSTSPNSENIHTPSTSGYKQPRLMPNSNEDTPLLKRLS